MEKFTLYAVLDSSFKTKFSRLTNFRLQNFEKIGGFFVKCAILIIKRCHNWAKVKKYSGYKKKKVNY